MKLYSGIHKGEAGVFMEHSPGQLIGLPYVSMNDLLTDDPQRRQHSILLAKAGQSPIPFSEVKMLPPIPNPIRDIICLGMNYPKHKTEAEQFNAQAFTREAGHAVYFSKRAIDCPGTGEEISGHFDLVDSLDYEVELAVILGQDAKNVPESEAFSYVFGYTILNDLSARNLQTRHKQWFFGKGLDGFTPIGPCIVTKEDFPQPPALTLRCFVNGQLRQEDRTDHLLFSIPHIIHELSQGMTLPAGTIIATGTPAGVGMGLNPPQFLRPGDVVRCEIEGIGVLENRIVE